MIRCFGLMHYILRLCSSEFLGSVVLGVGEGVVEGDACTTG